MLTVIHISSQNIHHQMISSQSASSTSSSGFIVKQTIGQISTTGSFAGKFNVQQGFQQSNWIPYLLASEEISITSYPNPFIQMINFNLIDLMDTTISVQIFDINGKSVYLNTHTVENSSFRVNLSILVTGTYLVNIKNRKLNHFTKIIKN